MANRVISADKLALALTEFVNRLQLAYRAVPMSAAEKTDPVSFAQWQHTLGLREVAKFLERIEADDDLVEQVAGLSSAIFDLSSGIVHPILQPKKLKTRKADNTDVWQSRILVVGALGCLMLSGMGKKSEAAKYIAKKFPKLSRLCRTGAKLETSILSWEKSLLEKTIKNDVAAVSQFSVLPPNLDAAEYKRRALNALKIAEKQAATRLVAREGSRNLNAFNEGET
jgi:hypothetical protein